MLGENQDNLGEKSAPLNKGLHLRSVFTERDRERGLAAFAKEWSE